MFNKGFSLKKGDHLTLVKLQNRIMIDFKLKWGIKKVARRPLLLPNKIM